MDTGGKSVAVTLKYLSIGNFPSLLVSVEDVFTGNRKLVRMVLDTGADETSFPAAFAAHFGHNNDHEHVECKEVHGVGGKSVAYVHSVRLSLLDPVKFSKTNVALAWTSQRNKAAFIQHLDAAFGLLGSDIMSEWKGFSIFNTHLGREIVIEI